MINIQNLKPHGGTANDEGLVGCEAMSLNN
jgi:hypothetical protein